LDITIRARNGHVSKRLKEFASLKLQRLSRFMPTITSMDMELHEDGSTKATGSHVAELTVATSGPVFRSKGAAADPRASIDIAVERAERQLKEFKRRKSGRPAHSRQRVHSPTMSGEEGAQGSLAEIAVAEPVGLETDEAYADMREGT
jgi:ribosomal subunit interface protein